MHTKLQNAQDREAARLFWLCWLAYAVVYIGRKNLSACLPVMIAQGVTDKLLGGAAGTGFLLFYALGQLSGGVLADRLSPRLMLSLGLFGSGAVNICMGLCSSAPVFVLLWCLNGAFASMLWPTVIRCLSEGIPLERRSKAGSRISTTIPAGSLLAYLLSAVLLRYASWRWVFFICGGILMLTACAEYKGIGSCKHFLYTLQTQKQNSSAVQPQKNDPQNAETIRGKHLVLLFLAAGVPFMLLGAVCNGALKDGFDFWIPTYITESFGVNASLTSLLTGILPIVNLLGVYLAKYLNDRLFHNEMRTCGAMFACSSVMLVPLCLLTMGDPAQGTAAKLAFSVLLIAVVSTMMLGLNSQLLTFIPFSFGKAGKAATVTGLLNASSYAAAALSDFFAGLLSKQYGWTVTLLAFFAVSASGMLACAIGAKRWEKGQALLETAV